MKRPMTLTGGIIGTIANAFLSVMYVIGIVGIIELLGGATGTVTVVVVAVLEMLVAVVALILSIVSIVAWSKDAAGYKKKKGAVITAAVFNFIGAILCFIAGTALYIVLALVLIAVGVLFIVDVCLEGKRIAKTTAPAETTDAE